MSGGNPLYAIELARALAVGRRAVPRRATCRSRARSRRDRAAARDACPPSSFRCSRRVSALGSTSVKELRATLGDAKSRRCCRPRCSTACSSSRTASRCASRTRCVGVRGLRRMSPLARRACMRAWPTIARIPDVRARHLALSTDEPGRGGRRAAGGGGRPGGPAWSLRPGGRVHAPQPPAHARPRTTTTRPPCARRDRAPGRGRRGEPGAHPRRPARGRASRPGRGVQRRLVQLASWRTTICRASEGLLLRALEDARDRRAAPRPGARPARLAATASSSATCRSGIACAYEAVAIADEAGDPGLQMPPARGSRSWRPSPACPSPTRMAQGGRARGGDRPAGALGRARGRCSASSACGPATWTGCTSCSRRVRATPSGSRNERRDRTRSTTSRWSTARPASCTRRTSSSRQGLESAQDAEDRHVEGWLLYPVALVRRLARPRGRGPRRRPGGGSSGPDARGERPGIARARERPRPAGARPRATPQPPCASSSVAARLLEEMGVGPSGRDPRAP